MSNFLSYIEARMLQYSTSHRVIAGHHQVVAICNDAKGFNVAVVQGRSDWSVMLGGWCNEEDCPQSVLHLVEGALSGRIRLKETSLGCRPWYWTIEEKGSGEMWPSIGCSGYFRFRLGRVPTTRVLINGATSKIAIGNSIELLKVSQPPTTMKPDPEQPSYEHLAGCSREHASGARFAA